jgi:cobalamin biosynthesis protein CbiD
MCRRHCRHCFAAAAAAAAVVVVARRNRQSPVNVRTSNTRVRTPLVVRNTRAFRLRSLSPGFQSFFFFI